MKYFELLVDVLAAMTGVVLGCLLAGMLGW